VEKSEVNEQQLHALYFDSIGTLEHTTRFYQCAEHALRMAEEESALEDSVTMLTGQEAGIRRTIKQIETALQHQGAIISCMQFGYISDIMCLVAVHDLTIVSTNVRSSIEGMSTFPKHYRRLQDR
jgi:hypothetical protein